MRIALRKLSGVSAHLRRNAGYQFCNGMAYYFVYRLLIS